MTMQSSWHGEERQEDGLGRVISHETNGGSLSPSTSKGCTTLGSVLSVGTHYYCALAGNISQNTWNGCAKSQYNSR